MNPLLIAQIIAFVTPLLKASFGDNVPTHIAGALLAHATQLISLSQDLALDGDAHLSTDNLNILARLVLDAKEGKL